MVEPNRERESWDRLVFFFLRGRLAGEKEAAHACRKEGLDYSILDYLIVVFCLNDVIYIYESSYLRLQCSVFLVGV